jgi:class 3 adenylate cyclase
VRVREPSVLSGLPVDPLLAEWAATLNAAGHWAWIYDASWRLVCVTDELRLRIAVWPVGYHCLSAETFQFLTVLNRGRYLLPEFRRARFLELGPYVLAGTPGGREELRAVADPEFADLITGLRPKDVPDTWPGPEISSTFAGLEVTARGSLFRIGDRNGNVVGFCELFIPAAGMAQLAEATYGVDLAYLDRVRSVHDADRRAAAILMADLEASSPLARRLPTAQYFAFVRRLVRAADRCIVDAGGIVGRHTGDGVTAFFLAETAGSESAAASACITAARSLRDTLADVAARSEIHLTDLALRFGLHWGATLYIGRIHTVGRSEVTALGDEMNEAARIEACATGGRALASKPLIERLNRVDADALQLDTGRTTYTPLAELATATDKARRDAPGIAVCDV